MLYYTAIATQNLIVTTRRRGKTHYANNLNAISCSLAANKRSAKVHEKYKNGIKSRRL